jgi:hypothetical protein
MALYIQHGHGKSDKIATALEDRTISGIIFGARNEKPDNLQMCLNEIRRGYNDCKLLFDPQFYVSRLNPPNDRYLPEYPYYTAGLTTNDFISPRRIGEFVRETLNYQVKLGLDSLISPTVIFDSFSDRWHQIALNLANASLEYHAELPTPPPLLLSFVFSENALLDTDEVNHFLDTVTQKEWNMQGFYIIIDRNDRNYNQRFEYSRLAQYLYLVYVLGHINNLHVICGYTDFIGILLRAVGAKIFASGWNHSLRQFNRSNFIKRRPGGSTPLQRYSSSPLLNSIRFNEELKLIHEIGRINDVLSNVEIDKKITDWTTPLSQQHHWQTLMAMDNKVSDDINANLNNIVQQLREADGLYRMLEVEGIQFDHNSGPSHLMEWVRAINEFQRIIGLPSS